MNINPIAKTLHKDYKGIKLPPSQLVIIKSKSILAHEKIAHTKISKLVGGTITLKTFGQDTMIIPPLSLRTVRGSTMSGRPLSWSTKTKYNKEESLVKD